MNQRVILYLDALGTFYVIRKMPLGDLGLWQARGRCLIPMAVLSAEDLL